MFKFLKLLQARKPAPLWYQTDENDTVISEQDLEHTPEYSPEQPDWSSRRHPPLDRDRTLTSDTHVWLRHIPSGLHPKRTSRLYPRIANRLARHWPDAARTEDLFDELLEDKRGGRAGFPTRVVNELIRLRSFHRRRRP